MGGRKSGRPQGVAGCGRERNPVPIVEPKEKMMSAKRSMRCLSGIVAVLALLGAPAGRAAVIYSQTFDTASSDLLSDYGFAVSGWNTPPTGSYTAAGGEAVMSTGPGYGRLTHTLSTPYAYDWSNPMTLSADLRGVQTSGNTTYGIFMGSASAGIAYSRNIGQYLQNGRGGDRDGNQQITGWLDPDMGTGVNAISNGTTFNISMTVRQNVADPANFDVLFQVNDVDQGIGWYTGISKATYGLDGNISQLGVRGDQIADTVYLDNLALSVIPEPASLGMLGAAAVAMLLRRRFRG
jgi:hypothetical protein